MHDKVIEQVDQRHADYEPVERVGHHHSHLATGHQPTGNRYLGGHDDNRVGVIPENIGVSSNGSSNNEAPAKPKEL